MTEQIELPFLNTTADAAEPPPVPAAQRLPEGAVVNNCDANFFKVPATQQLPEGAVVYMQRWLEWALRLPPDDAKQIVQLMQAVQAAHISSEGATHEQP